MGIADIIVLGVALSADAFAVTISNSFAYSRETLWRKALMPIFFGLFQFLMPVAGYFVGGVAAEFIERYSGIVTLVILGVIGGNMVREGVGSLRRQREQDDERAREDVEAWSQEAESRSAEVRDITQDRDARAADAASADPSHASGRLTIPMLLFQAVATAIDAFAVGVSLRALGVNIFSSAGIIGLTTTACCTAALFIGRRLGDLLGDRAQVVGGVVLIAIGLRAFLG